MRPHGRPRMIEKPHRDLAQLEHTGSSARVLSLVGVHRRHATNPQYYARPFFRDPLLNRAIILKHRLRRDERELFIDGRQTTTKIILPLDIQDLRLGGRSVLVNQSGYQAIMREVFGEHWSAENGDRELLEVIDTTLSLDPFLLREHLRRHGREPARCYFDISAADYARMNLFVERDIRRFVEGGEGGEPHLAAGTNMVAESRLARRLLASDGDGDNEPLRLTLEMERQDFAEGVFSWKGFLYYKWTLVDALPRVKAIAKAIATVRPNNRPSGETQAELDNIRRSLARSILMTCEAARATLKAYDVAFASLINGQPLAFREFLGHAPGLFTELGQRLGGISHVISFWTYRFENSDNAEVSAEELMDIFLDFEEALTPTQAWSLTA